MNYVARRHRRKPELIRPSNMLKAKVGSGGLSEDTLQQAEFYIQDNDIAFQPLAEIYLESLWQAITTADSHVRAADTLDSALNDQLMADILVPALELKANAGMFGFPLITRLAALLVHFLESVQTVDRDVLAITRTCHATVRALLIKRVTGNALSYGDALVAEFDNACLRYIKRHPENSKRRLTV